MSDTALVPLREIPLPKLVDRLEPVASALDGVSADERVNYVRGLGMGQLRALWELAKGTELRTSDLLLTDRAVTVGEGKNGLPVFCWFQKRFALVDGEVVGYNHNSAFVTFFVGPGHFTAYDSPDTPGEVWIDYRKIPTTRHAEFPELAPNDRGLFPRLVYGGMVDKVRRVSRHVVIGDSFIAEGMKPKYVPFALCLPDAPSPSRG